MNLQYTLEQYVLQLKNAPRPLLAVAGVVQKIMKVLYGAHFPNAENRRPARMCMRGRIGDFRPA